jgi:hypothetical protein
VLLLTILTLTVTVTVADALSVTTHCAVPVLTSPSLSPVAENVVDVAVVDVIVMNDPPDCQVQAYVYPGVPRMAVTTADGVVWLAVVKLDATVDGDTVAASAVEIQLIDTDTVVVRTTEPLSVTVQSAWPVRVVPAVRLVALNVVLADEAEVIVMPVPPVLHVHA